MKIRRAQKRDIDQIIHLSKLWEDERVTYGVTANTAEDLSTIEENHFYVSEINEKVVGYVYGRLKENPGLAVLSAQDEFYFEIDELYLHPEHRNQGIGSELMSTLTAELRKDGINRIVVSSANKDWRQILNFYENQGFSMWTITLFK